MTEILYASNLLENSAFLYNHIASLGSKFAIISDTNVSNLYGSALLNKLRLLGLEIDLFEFPSGEQNKTRQTKEFLEDELFKKKYNKDTCIVALGGGVVTDIAGFIAATYCRGVNLTFIPTTLLAMVDASIGGKNGVNLPFGKNLIGTIYPPKKVFIDPFFLKNLPLSELKNGIIEMIKHGLILDANHFTYLEQNFEKILSLDSTAIKTAIFDSCLIKKQIVEKDENEQGLRRILNYGHTIGHGLEKLSNYSIPHGLAVAVGIAIESHLSMQLGFLEEAALERILHIFNCYSIPWSFPKRFSPQDLLEAMTFDKKSLKKSPRFVLIDAIGSTLSFDRAYCRQVNSDLIINSTEWAQNALCSD